MKPRFHYECPLCGNNRPPGESAPLGVGQDGEAADVAEIEAAGAGSMSVCGKCRCLSVVNDAVSGVRLPTYEEAADFAKRLGDDPEFREQMRRMDVKVQVELERKRQRRAEGN